MAMKIEQTRRHFHRSITMASRFIAMLACLLIVSGAVSPLLAQRSPPEVTVAAPIRKKLVQWDEYTGQFEALRRVDVRSRVSGELVGIHFSDGDVVKAGQLLFTIDRRPFEIAVEVARGEVARSRAQVALTAADFERAEKLAPSSVVTQRDREQRKANYDVAAAQLQIAEAALRNAELNLEWTSIQAPIEGRISDRKIDIGNLISGGQAGASLLTSIVSLNPIHFVFNVPEPDYVRYTRLSSAVTSRPVQVRLADEKDWGRNGRMNFVDNQLNGRSGTIRGRAVLKNDELLLTPGAFGRLRLFAGEVEAALIPDAAVVADQSRKVVYTVGPDNKIIAKPITLGPIEGTLRVVADGLSADDRVVIAGLANPAVRAGASVVPVPGKILVAERRQNLD
jgi:multidrug efflux system membrane fusion protein